MKSIIDKYINTIDKLDTIHYSGSVTAVKGMLIESKGPQSVMGEICIIKVKKPNYVPKDVFYDCDYTRLTAEVVGLNDKTVQLMVYGDTKGIEVGSEVIATGSVLKIGVSNELLGRVLNAQGKPCDNKGEIIPETYYQAENSPPPPLERKSISKRIVTGVRAIDTLLAIGKGQRVGIFAGSGVGKSTLLSMIARNTNADVNVIALIGERGREVIDFIERDLGPEGLKRSVVIAATSDQSPIERLRGAYTATAIAEYFRDQGKDVMLMFDSVTRFAHAQREIGLAAGEPPAQRGYPPSVFELLPKLLERSGTSQKGTITAFYTVLVDGDDMDEPIADKVRGTLDGHIVLNRKLAQASHYPAIDILASISRLANRVGGVETNTACSIIRRLIATYKESEDLINVGAYQNGSNPDIDEAIRCHKAIEAFLMQGEYDPCYIENSMEMLAKLANVKIPIEEYEYAITAKKDKKEEVTEQQQVLE